MIRDIVRCMAAGKAIAAPQLFNRAWDECVELQVMDKDTWVGQSLLWLQNESRWEIVFYSTCAERVIGGLVLAEDNDPHVGRCMTVLASYVEPEFRGIIGKRMYHQAFALAKKLGYPVLAYTHRQKDWVYTTTYRKLK